MRSKKEIKEEIETGKKHDEIDKWGECSSYYIWDSALEWVIEGKPRYSVAELEKIMKTILLTPNKSREPFVISEFIKFLKDKSRVEEILK